MTAATEPAVPTPLARAAAWSWRLIVIGVVVLAVLWVLREALVVVVPVIIAVFVTRVLSPIVGWLRARHLPGGVAIRPGFAAALTMVVAAAALAGVLTIAGRSFASEADSLGPTITEAIDDIEDWLVDDSPFDVSRDDVDSVRQRIADGIDELGRSANGALAERATLAAEVFTGALLSVILTFFLLRDGRRLTEWSIVRAGDDRSDRFRRSLEAAWSALAGYLRGAAALGVIESVIIGVTLWLVGADLVAAVMILTFLGAFVPIVGAVVAGTVAVLVALVTASTSAAVIVAVVALLVQQFDNDLLAPFVYGRALDLHPAVVLISVVAGGALFGFGGTVLAVPVVAVATSVFKEYRSDHPPPTVDEVAATT